MLIEKKDAFAERKAMIMKQIEERNKRDRSFLRTGIYGEPKVCKSSLALDSLTEQQIKDGWKVWVLDWDSGCEPTWRNNYNAAKHIEIFDPNVYNDDGSPNLELSEQLSEDFVRMVQEALDEGTKGKFVLDGVDKWKERCFDTLTKGKKDSDFRFPPHLWGKRNRRYKLLMDKIFKLPCDVFLITHLKDVYEGINNPNPVGKEPDWHKMTPPMLYQTISVKKMKKGNKFEHIATIDASKTNTLLVGKRYVVLTVEDGNVVWKNIPELQEGSL